jgi:hypothetical protein
MTAMGATDGDQIETLSGDPTLMLPEFDDPPEDPLPLFERWLKLADERVRVITHYPELRIMRVNPRSELS